MDHLRRAGQRPLSGVQTADHVANKARRSMWAVCVLATGLLAVAGSILFAAVNRPEPFDPLGPYPQQQVDEPRDNTDTPSVSIDNPVVHVNGRKCNEGSGYTITGTVSWQSLDPRGTSIRTGEGQRDAIPGCTRFRYRNDVPDAVLAIMRRQVDDGLRPLWRITGTETPINGDGEGVPLTWATEPFRVTP